MKLVISGLVLGLSSLAWASPAPTQLSDLAQHAQVVVAGEVVSTQAEWRGGLIVSEVVVQTDECWQGECPSEAIVRVPGGQIDGVGMHLSGAPRFVEGETVVLFLEPSVVPSRFRVVSQAQGKFVHDRTSDRVRRGGTILPTAFLRAAASAVVQRRTTSR